jgi:hypothetical protein
LKVSRLSWKSPVGLGDAEQADRGDDRRAGPGVDAEDAGVGERVAGQRLHQRPRQPERHPDQQPERGARQPDVGHDRRVAAVEMAGQRLHDLRERDRARPHRKAQKDRERERGERGGKDGNSH